MKSRQQEIQRRFDREASHALWVINQCWANRGTRAIPDREFDEFLNGGTHQEAFKNSYLEED